MISRIQYFSHMLLFVTVCSLFSAGLIGGIHEMDHPGKKQMQTAMANLFVGLILIWWMAGIGLR